MAARRILSLWFPRLAAERVLRLRRDVLPVPLAVVSVVQDFFLEAVHAFVELPSPVSVTVAE